METITDSYGGPEEDPLQALADLAACLGLTALITSKDGMENAHVKIPKSKWLL